MYLRSVPVVYVFVLQLLYYLYFIITKTGHASIHLRGFTPMDYRTLQPIAQKPIDSANEYKVKTFFNLTPV